MVVNPGDENVALFVDELTRKLKESAQNKGRVRSLVALADVLNKFNRGVHGGGGADEHRVELPFELKVLEVCLDAVRGWGSAGRGGGRGVLQPPPPQPFTHPSLQNPLPSPPPPFPPPPAYRPLPFLPSLQLGVFMGGRKVWGRGETGGRQGAVWGRRVWRLGAGVAQGERGSCWLGRTRALKPSKSPKT